MRWRSWSRPGNAFIMYQADRRHWGGTCSSSSSSSSSGSSSKLLQQLQHVRARPAFAKGERERKRPKDGLPNNGKRVSRSAPRQDRQRRSAARGSDNIGAKLQKGRRPGIRLDDRWTDSKRKGGKDTRAVRSARLLVRTGVKREGLRVANKRPRVPPKTRSLLPVGALELGPHCLPSCCVLISAVSPFSLSSMGSSGPAPRDDRVHGHHEVNHVHLHHVHLHASWLPPESAPRCGMISCAELQCLGPAACVAHLLSPSGFFLGPFGVSH